ncbi:hypothetical protein, partial [Staphylococcus aureus]
RTDASPPIASSASDATTILPQSMFLTEANHASLILSSESPAPAFFGFFGRFCLDSLSSETCGVNF